MTRKRKIRIIAVPRNEPNVRLYVLALLELAKQIQDEEEARRAIDEAPDGQEDEQ